MINTPKIISQINCPFEKKIVELERECKKLGCITKWGVASYEINYQNLQVYDKNMNLIFSIEGSDSLSSPSSVTMYEGQLKIGNKNISINTKLSEIKQLLSLYTDTGIIGYKLNNFLFVDFDQIINEPTVLPTDVLNYYYVNGVTKTEKRYINEDAKVKSFTIINIGNICLSWNKAN